MTAEPPSLDLSRFDPAHLNYSALTEPITPAQVRVFRTQTRAAQRANPGIATGLQTATSLISVGAVVVVVGIFATVLILIASSMASLAVGGANPGAVIFVIIFALVFAGIAVVVIRSVFGLGGNWAKWMRLSQFASANGLLFRTRSPNLSYPGCIFQVGNARCGYDQLTSTSGRFLDLGDYRYSTGSGRSRQLHTWGYLALQLDRKLPNMVLDSKANNGLFGSTNLPETFKRDQVLSLEGDFDKYFTLYCPQQYEQDALYVFTPDLMALLIDDAAPFDVEIVDDWMFVYSAKPFDELSFVTYERLFGIVTTVGSKTLSQTEQYHDDRVGSPGANIVAPQGQRLRHGTSIGAIVGFGVIAVFWLWNAFHGFIH